MIRLDNLAYSRGGRTLMRNVSLTLLPRSRTGIVGANGTGKSSFFSCVRGELHADAGDIQIPGGWVMAHVGQETPATETIALEFVLQGDAELVALEKEIAALSLDHSDEAGNRLADAYAQLDNIGGHSARSRAAELLAGLGFGQDQLEMPVKSFSGGWRMRLNLAQALMTRSDLLLLDEPTNHLDMDAVLWLEGWLIRYPGMLLMITHDRDFLDAVAQNILHFDNTCGATLYTGNYSSFEQQRGERLVLQQAAFEKQQRQVKHLEAFITRFRAKATKAKQAQSRIKALEKMERIAAAHVDSPFSFSFRKPVGEPRMLIRLEHADIGYGERTILHDVEFSVLPNSRIGLLGRNGEGKSTLMKALAGERALTRGVRHEGHHLKIGYFAQHQLDILRPDETAFWHMLKCDAAEAAHFGRGLAREQELRDFLGGFDFRGERLNDPVKIFSGGEKARLALALIVWQKPNLLLLDEPTNHLDIEMRHALTEALLDYEGALIVVSHDRHLLRACCDEMVWVHGGKAEIFEGDLDDYRDAVKIAPQVIKPQNKSQLTPKADRIDEKKLSADARVRLTKMRKPLESEIQKIEAQIAKLNQTRAPITAWLQQPCAYQPEHRERLAQQSRSDGEIAAEIAGLELRWIEATEKLESVQ